MLVVVQGALSCRAAHCPCLTAAGTWISAGCVDERVFVTELFYTIDQEIFSGRHCCVTSKY